MVVLITGANGQLGQAIQSIAQQYPAINFIFCSSQELDITKEEAINTLFLEVKPDFCINTAAYTAVDKAESEPEKAHLINAVGPGNLAAICKKTNTTLLHISTDFVFDGQATTPYSEKATTNPQSVYGQTKLDGEKAVQAVWEKHFIIRTSWVYSQFGANFMKTMLRLGAERDSLSVVNDQIGTPTNAVDLAEAIIEIIKHTQNLKSETLNLKSIYGIYNFSNEGQCSWYDFAKKIFEVNMVQINLLPIATIDYPTPAKRPKYSVLEKTKIKETFGINIKNWDKRVE
ncbi:MAG TPA: dTDP-4-dehydrorhamnose reductase [Flavobacterium sp.]|jgi:dTDP-4-dehydrorhamnose reductase